MKLRRYIFVMTAAISLASCGSDEPRYANPEAHEKTVQLNEQYGPIIVGTWHYENSSDTQRYFERLTFQADGKMNGIRKWQTRQLVTIDGEQRYTDWEDVELSGTFTGTWRLQWVRNDSGVGENHLILYAPFDVLDDEGNGWMAYSYNGLFDYDSTTTTLRISGFHHQDADGWTSYLRGDAEPSF